MYKFPTWPVYAEDEIIAATEVLRSGNVNYWTGSQCKIFEAEFADYVGTKFGLALANGTLALELALRAAGIGAGDEVIVTPRTFIASVSAIVNIGATPIFADIDLETQNITADTARKVVSAKTKAIICVHLAGWPCDMDPILELSRPRGIVVIEDCAQAHGALYKGRSVGGLGDIGCWSFCQDKIMSTGGEGGMVTTNSEKYWKWMWSYKDHGKNFDKMTTPNTSSSFRWVHDEFGSNYRMTEFQAAIGRSQLRKLEAWQKRRSLHAEKIWNLAEGLKFLRPPERTKCSQSCRLSACGCRHACYKAYVFVDGDVETRDLFINEITARGVPCFTGVCGEVYEEKAFIGHQFKPNKKFPNAAQLSRQSVMFLCHPTLSDEDLNRMCAVIVEAHNVVFN